MRILLAIFLLSGTAYGFSTRSCNGAQTEQIDASVAHAIGMLEKVNYFLDYASTSALKVRLYFGGKEQSVLTEEQLLRLKENFLIVHREALKNDFRYICRPRNEKYLASNNPGWFNRIWLYENYFHKDIGDRAKTLIHEWTHEFLNTDDLGYEGDAYKLSTDDQLNNAENYEHLARDLGAY
jgi:Lysine-specific metallo-endopeptidase